MVKLAHVIEVDEQTINETDLEAAHLYMGCENLRAIPEEFNTV